jgi:hypothetical protein
VVWRAKARNPCKSQKKVAERERVKKLGEGESSIHYVIL